ncbi:UDP-2,3-diacylglucosamine hydrolase [Candidatus Arsenophonus lipoptenae]|uniref:UDP-2,3-diacylglucosamine hydrolase n=1 Tax=Candidatus Arsenophonus lipoptenae TaxID=634113 RepID=A0A0X9W6P6_9GAMM|nr:UDP-2,3-diacylglucosamine diphosphatase [Candidatus Arsenophonus lipoptenae]AMA64942.1 UDP-2,3-diacylglucosamine hydrolase [Candidatus Arsenophonus lipoptenae]
MILFIADVHLNKKKPDVIHGFLRFLREQAIKADSLYILGDFFDYWIGDDDSNLLYLLIAKELKKLKFKGIFCYFIPGNHDFLLNKKFANNSGMLLLPTEQVLTLYSYNILILHGDVLCTDDVSYQRYRKRVYNHWLQQLFLALPLSIRYFILKKIREKSQYNNSIKSLNITDVNKQTVIETFTKYQVDWIIHGHTHRPAIHKININGKILHRAVLGAWHKNGSVIKITSKSIELFDFYF